jgi:phenylacetate-CoA ligase
VLDHSGATEVGPWGYGTADGTGLHVTESEFIAEFLPHENDVGAQELVLTNLGRVGWPIIRYRTGDLVIPKIPQRGFVELQRGILARTDEMVVIRGVNVFPSAIEETLRQFPEVDEFRIVLFKEREMDALRIELDGHAAHPERIAEAVQRRLGLRAEVVGLPTGSLPRFEAKSRRFVDERT